MFDGNTKLSVDQDKDIKYGEADRYPVYTLDYIKSQFEIVTIAYWEEIEKNNDLVRIVNFLQKKGFEEKYTISELLELVNKLENKKYDYIIDS